MPETREYDAEEISISVGGTRVADLESMGYDQSKTHELTWTIGDGKIWVNGRGEYSGTFNAYATSPAIPAIESLFENDIMMSISVKYAPQEPRGSSSFLGAKLLDFGPSDYDGESLPTYEGSWEAAQARHG